MRGLAVRGWAFAIVAALAAVALVATPQPAEAFSGSDFDPGYIISDSRFYDGNAMAEAEIQSFLTAASGTCQNSNCLAVHRISTTTTSAGFGPCATYQGAPDESAARIIYKVQKACGISAKVLLVTLQKEQGLVTKSAPTSLELRKAMGQGCPDTSDCDSNYYGLQKQLYFGSRQLTWYGNPAGSFTHIKVGQSNNIKYHPNSGCGTGPVTVKNRATAALYYYTPYQPNAAALANLYGTGNACSSYGNRNFWVYYNSWFGTPTGNPSPIGNVEVVAAGPGTFRVAGWAIDPDTSQSIEVHVYVGTAGTALKANLSRADVGAAYPDKGPLHGFDSTVLVSATGPNEICAYAINVGPGGNVLLGCRTVTAMSGSPVGKLSGATGQAGGITVAGWAVDPDTINPTSVHVYVGSAGKAIVANAPSTAAATAYPAYGSNHGFTVKLPAAPGTHQVCAYGMNVGLGSNVQLGCKSVVVPSGEPLSEQGRPPVGALDSVTAASDGVTVSGWTLDPDTAASIAVHIYVGVSGSAHTANKDRPDLLVKYPANGAAHGFAEKIPAKPGTHAVCAYGINAGPGGHTLLGCKNVTVPQPQSSLPERGRVPLGNLEAVTVSADGIAVSGWTLDPDTTASIAVHVYVGSTGVAYVANKDRGDVGAAYPGYGSAHGFAEKIAAKPGTHTVCAYGINAGPGGHTLLGCKTVTL
jgi:hypothetical protein